MSSDRIEPTAQMSGNTHGRHAAASAISKGMALIVLALAAPLAQSQSANSERRATTIDELKRVYLSCSDAVTDGQLNKQEVMSCSVVYEELKQRAFDGDFDKLLAWSRLHPSAQKTGRQNLIADSK